MNIFQKYALKLVDLIAKDYSEWVNGAWEYTKYYGTKQENEIEFLDITVLIYLYLTVFSKTLIYGLIGYVLEKTTHISKFLEQEG